MFCFSFIYNPFSRCFFSFDFVKEVEMVVTNHDFDDGVVEVI